MIVSSAHLSFVLPFFKWALTRPETCFFLIEHLQGLTHMLLLFLEHQSVCLENEKFDECCFPKRSTCWITFHLLSMLLFHEQSNGQCNTLSSD